MLAAYVTVHTSLFWFLKEQRFVWTRCIFLSVSLLVLDPIRQFQPNNIQIEISKLLYFENAYENRHAGRETVSFLSSSR